MYSLQKAMIFTPCAPNAGPTGGDGLAFPAGKANLIYPDTAQARRDQEQSTDTMKLVDK